MKTTLEPLTITIARAILEDGRVRIESKAPETIELADQQSLHLQVQYRFEESDHSREQFRLRLRSRAGDEQPDDVVRKMDDRPFITDSEWGIIQQRYPPFAHGKHELWVDVRAEYSVSAWDGKGEETLDSGELATGIQIVVDRPE